MITYNKHVHSSMFELIDDKYWLKKESIILTGDKYELFDLEWEWIESAKSFAIAILDYDSSRVVGQPFVHFLAANIKWNKLKTASNLYDEYIMGVNSTCPVKDKNTNGIIFEALPKNMQAPSYHHATNYLPPSPPDKDHMYTIVIYGIEKEKLNLKNGFFYGEFNKQIINHVVGIRFFNFWFAKE